MRFLVRSFLESTFVVIFTTAWKFQAWHRKESYHFCPGYWQCRPRSFLSGSMPPKQIHGRFGSFIEPEPFIWDGFYVRVGCWENRIRYWRVSRIDLARSGVFSFINQCDMTAFTWLPLSQLWDLKCTERTTYLLCLMCYQVKQGKETVL